MSRNPIIRMDKVFVKNILMSNTYLIKKNNDRKRKDGVDKNTLTDSFEVDSEHGSKYDDIKQPRKIEDMMKDSVYGLFFKVPIDMRLNELD